MTIPISCKELELRTKNFPYRKLQAQMFSLVKYTKPLRKK